MQVVYLKVYTKKRFKKTAGPMGLPRWHSAKNPLANTGDTSDVGSIPGLGRFPEAGDGKALQFLTGKCHRQRSLVGCSPGDCKESDITEQLIRHTHTRANIKS